MSISPIVLVENLSKTYASGEQALKNVTLHIHEGEILALLGPNGAGKTTLISIICGLVNASSGQVIVNGYDNVRDYRKAREQIGLVPQELALGMFDRVWDALVYNRGLFGKPPDPDYLLRLLADLSLSKKKNMQMRTLSGGMKRRVLIAKALAHEPSILFLDEPTAGVDVELRKDMWRLVERLREQGVTIILTTHYIEEAEAIADRIGIIHCGTIALLDSKQALMRNLGKRQMHIDLVHPLKVLPPLLQEQQLSLSNDGLSLCYPYQSEGISISGILQAILQCGLQVREVRTSQSSLEDIFLGWVNEKH